MVTMADIANRAGVSRATVSLVLNAKHATVGIAEETRQRVLRTAAELGYRPNELARAMVTGRNPVIGFLVPQMEREVATRILAATLREAEAHGHSVRVIHFNDAPDNRSIERCGEMRLAGLMALYIYDPALSQLQAEMARYGVPVAVVDSSFPQERGIRVISDDQDGCHQVITYLAGLGHQRIAFISGGTRSGSSTERETGYRRAIENAGLELREDYIVCGRWTIPVIEEVTQQVLSLPDRPTALCCVDDRTAFIAARTAHRMGIRIPEDLSLVGFADLEMAEYGDPPLTTVAQPFKEMGVEAVRQLLAAGEERRRTKQEWAEPVEVLLPTKLVIRKSTAPAR